MNQAMKNYVVSLSVRLTIFLGCCKEFGAFDIAGIFMLDAWDSYKICESLVDAGIVSKIDECPDDSDFDDIIYIPNSQFNPHDNYITVLNVINTIDENILDNIKSIYPESEN